METRLYTQNLLDACDKGDIQKVQALLKAKTNVNIQDKVTYVCMCVCFRICSGIITYENCINTLVL